MEQKRLTLDNPVFAGTLRYQHRGARYERRPVQKAPLNDVVAVRRPQAMRPAQTLATPVSQSVVSRLAPKLQQMAPHQAPVDQPVQPPVMQMPKVAAIQPPQLQGVESFVDSKSQALLTARPLSPEHAPDEPAQPVVPKNLLRKLPNPKIVALYTMAAVVFIAGVLVSISGLHANQKVAAQVTQAQHQAVQTAGQSSVGTTVPSAVKPSAKVMGQYTVAPTLPKYIDIPALSIHARTLSEGVTSKGDLDVPWNIYDTGWYNASAQPGQPGAMLIDGHSGISRLHGVFHDVANLALGANITITRGDNTKVTYSVVKVQVVDVAAVDMSSMVVSADAKKPGLNLITCAGDQIPGTTELNKRVQVYAVLQ